MRVLTIKMDCCQTTITQLVLDGKDAIVEKTMSFLSYLGYTKIDKPELYVAKIKDLLKKNFPLYKKSKLLLIVPPDFCEERFIRDPDIIKIAKEEGTSVKNFVLTDAGLGKMKLVTEQEARELDPLLLAFCRQGLIPNYVVSPLYSAWKLAQVLIPQKDEILIVHPTMQNLSYTLIKEGVPQPTHFGEASIAGFISKLTQQDIDEIKAMQMMVVFGVEPMELNDTGFDYREYPVLLVDGEVKEIPAPVKEKKEKPSKKKSKAAPVDENSEIIDDKSKNAKNAKKQKKNKSSKKSSDINDFSLDDLSMTDMQYETFNSGVSRFSEELKTEISLLLDDFEGGVQSFLISSDMVTDLNMRIHDCADIAEYVLTVPSGMILKAHDVNIRNEALEDLKTAQMLSIGAAVATYRPDEIDESEEFQL